MTEHEIQEYIKHLKAKLEISRENIHSSVVTLKLGPPDLNTPAIVAMVKDHKILASIIESYRSYGGRSRMSTTRGRLHIIFGYDIG